MQTFLVIQDRAEARLRISQAHELETKFDGFSVPFRFSLQQVVGLLGSNKLAVEQRHLSAPARI